MKKIFFLLLIPAIAKSQITPTVTTVNVGSGLVWTPKTATEGTITAPSLATIQATQTTQGATLSTHETRIKAVESYPPSSGTMPAPITVSTSSYKLTQGDNNRTLFVSSTCVISASFVTLPFRVHIIRTGTGSVSFIPSGITLNSNKGYRKINLQYNDAWIDYMSSSLAVLTGKLTY